MIVVQQGQRKVQRENSDLAGSHLSNLLRKLLSSFDRFIESLIMLNWIDLTGIAHYLYIIFGLCTHHLGSLIYRKCVNTHHGSQRDPSNTISPALVIRTINENYIQNYICLLYQIINSSITRQLPSVLIIAKKCTLNVVIVTTMTINDSYCSLSHS